MNIFGRAGAVLRSGTMTFAAGLALCFGTPVHAVTTYGVFDIDLQLSAGMTDVQQNAFRTAEAVFEGMIAGYAEPVTAGKKLVINASIEAIDGAGKVLGSAGPWSTFKTASYTYSNYGRMRFDSADVGRYSASRLVDLIVHEMAHVLGFGTLWAANGLYSYGSGKYTGRNALEAYRLESGNADATYVPVELGGGYGTANSHWDERDGGGGKELMTGWFDSGSTISKTTIASFADLGYVLKQMTSEVAPVPVPAAGLLLLGGLGSLIRIRRRSAAASNGDVPQQRAFFGEAAQTA